MTKEGEVNKPLDIDLKARDYIHLYFKKENIRMLSIFKIKQFHEKIKKFLGEQI